MKKILNYGIAYIQDKKPIDLMFFSKMSMIEAYINLLRSGTDISNLKCYQWEGIKNPVYRETTGEINKFLYR